MDASFDAYGGGGWGDEADKSMLSTQRKAEFDKVPIPVLVYDLCRMMQGEENYVIGAHKFTTVRIVARVVQAQEVDNGNQLIYDVIDTNDNDTKNVFKIVHYQGVDARQYGQCDTFQTGSIIHAIGRLRSFDGRLNLVAFQIRPVEGEGEIEAFNLETKLAKIYYGVKNIPDRLINNSMDEFRGTLFSAEAPDRSKPTDAAAGITQGRPLNPAQSRQQNVGPPSAKRLQQQSTDGGARGLIGQKARIYDLLMKNNVDEQGLSVGSIKQMLRNFTPRFEQDLAELVDDGVIYQTLDDQHYAAV
uniref:Replication protein A C-terminal domain-containing protein n=2 Tax=Acrobeloides nanus TaxID=290746 RepID=A0A914C433_9BILA